MVESKIVCDKISYDTCNSAQDAILHIIKKQNKNGMRVYRCNECGKFHITTIKTNKGMRDRKIKYPIQIPAIKHRTVVPKTTLRKKGKDRSIETTFRPFEFLING